MEEGADHKRKPRQISRARLLKAALGGTAGVVGGASLASFSASPAAAASGGAPAGGQAEPGTIETSSAARPSPRPFRRATNLLIRVQARGGKYLGDDIGGSLVTVRDVQLDQVLASGTTSGNAGTLAAAYAPGASQSAIVTPGSPPTVQWLVPDSGTGKFSCRVNLGHASLLEIAVFGPLGGLQTAHQSTVTQWVRPGDNLAITVDMPGLLVQVLEPPTHLELPKPGSVVHLKAKVAMMCGCPIQPGMPWVPSDFEVMASIRRIPSTPVADVRLRFASRLTPGIFEGTYRVPAAGFYGAVLEARQISTGNCGLGEVTFFTTPTAP